MPKQVVVVIKRRGRKRGLGAACYHSYIQKSHDYWVWRVEWLYKLDADTREKGKSNAAKSKQPVKLLS